MLLLSLRVATRSELTLASLANTASMYCNAVAVVLWQQLTEIGHCWRVSGMRGATVSRVELRTAGLLCNSSSCWTKSVNVAPAQGAGVSPFCTRVRGHTTAELWPRPPGTLLRLLQRQTETSSSSSSSLSRRFWMCREHTLCRFSESLQVQDIRHDQEKSRDCVSGVVIVPHVLHIT